MFARHRDAQLIEVLKSFGCVPDNAGVVENDLSLIEEDPNLDRAAEAEPWDGTPAGALEEVEERVRELMDDEGISELMAYERAIGENPTRFAMAKRHTVRKVGFVIGGDWQPPRPEADVPTSEAYRNLLKRAEQDQRAGETSEQSFARAYADPANRTLVDADRAEQHARVAKAMGGGVRG
jgi:hypothetical protein